MFHKILNESVNLATRQGSQRNPRLSSICYHQVTTNLNYHPSLESPISLWTLISTLDHSCSDSAWQHYHSSNTGHLLLPATGVVPSIPICCTFRTLCLQSFFNVLLHRLTLRRESLHLNNGYKHQAMGRYFYTCHALNTNLFSIAVHGRNRWGQDGAIMCSRKVEDWCRGRLFCLPHPYGCSCAAGYQGINCTEGKLNKRGKTMCIQ